MGEMAPSRVLYAGIWVLVLATPMHAMHRRLPALERLLPEDKALEATILSDDPALAGDKSPETTTFRNPAKDCSAWMVNVDLPLEGKQDPRNKGLYQTLQEYLFQEQTYNWDTVWDLYQEKVFQIYIELQNNAD